MNVFSPLLILLMIPYPFTAFHIPVLSPLLSWIYKMIHRTMYKNFKPYHKFNKKAKPTLPFHIVQMSPWPLITSSSAGLLAFSLVSWFSSFTPLTLIPIGLLLTLLITVYWWRDVIREATFMGDHSTNIQTTLSLSMLLFITSEVMFFSAFFWAFFHSSLSPSPEMGCQWPPKGVHPLNPFAIPLLNTAILLSSGLTVTWAHEDLVAGHMTNTFVSLTTTIILGVYFTLLQSIEYLAAEFSFYDGAYGSTFFIATGFHGCHVIIGTIFLIICNLRLISKQFSQSHHMGFEMAAWYWHFVDVIWLYLFVCIYWWTS